MTSSTLLHALPSHFDVDSFSPPPPPPHPPNTISIGAIAEDVAGGAETAAAAPMIPMSMPSPSPRSGLSRCLEEAKAKGVPDCSPLSGRETTRAPVGSTSHVAWVGCEDGSLSAFDLRTNR